MSDPALDAPAERLPLRVRLALYDLDGVTLLVLPAVVFIVALFVYPFIYGFVLSFQPKKGTWLANYAKFFSDPFLYDTIEATFRLAIPATLINTLVSIPVALRVRRMRNRRVLTTILVIPITLGTVLIAEGLLIYLGPQGWFNRTLILLERRAGAPGAQLHRRHAVADPVWFSLHFPADAVLPDGHRSLTRAGGVHARCQSAGALLVRSHAAAGARASNQPVPVLRADIFRVSLGCAARRAGRRYPCDLDRRLSGRLRAI